MDARGWLLDYSKMHGDTSPLNGRVFLPTGLKQYYYASYLRDLIMRGVPVAQISSQTTFLKVWREDLPWVKIRTPSGPFTHCGICEYLKMLISSASDSAIRTRLMLRLGGATMTFKEHSESS